MAEKMTPAAREHIGGLPMPPLHPGSEFVEHVSDGNGVLHLCREDNGDVVLLLDDAVLLGLAESDVRWLAAQLVAALDNWPRQG